MNRLPVELQEDVISALVEGVSIRSVERMTGVHRDTIMRLSVRVGQACDRVLDEMMYGLNCRRLEVDEIWTYVGKKDRHITGQDDAMALGSFWTWVAMDAETKLIPTWRVGKRDQATAQAFMLDLASRLENRVQLSTDGLRLYVEAIEAGFAGNVDWATVVKTYEAEPMGEGRYSPPSVASVDKRARVGKPRMNLASTSYVERGNLTMRMQMRRFTRLTNAFSKKRENLEAAVGLHFGWYNLVRKHRTIAATPAMAAGLAEWPWTIRDLLALSQ